MKITAAWNRILKQQLLDSGQHSLYNTNRNEGRLNKIAVSSFSLNVAARRTNRVPAHC